MYIDTQKFIAYHLGRGNKWSTIYFELSELCQIYERTDPTDLNHAMSSNTHLEAFICKEKFSSTIATALRNHQRALEMK
jgi:hypothetical protein